MPQPTPQARQRTRAFARVLGPFVAVVTLIITIRLPSLGDLLGDLFTSGTLPWILGAAMFVMGLVVIAFHQYWYSVTAVLISLFGWFVALRGVAMMAIPSAIQTGANATVTSPGLLIAARGFFLLLTAMGLWFTYVGWRPERTEGQ
ncbi:MULTISPECIES: hypothetical protein [unclassified Mycolicibacterium]|uniref:hypothetical protein n=1 Tax=unclassified Mycolicibacterium TaxID=2636767 RepID=UPI0012DCBD97|nr:MULTISPECIES: hypothetical protein [unclassified Mycolicibacterium]MUL82497.1 hypothetical protein [Mycolicibacterium sp. CBMA 329]MUL91371.1 hypothetical protein [Mycolicibacterium sp. CBMA 331]MUM01494.1 hypothetical protein [Mycolicibacterium sp. CBMA 334]MUM27421.1 hypothetical protein [Mycolicibacterium sp. CBMA 295]MUM41795.1 hypothetical protein [Mycolicibacterium sp. CBMA 247]